MSARLLLTSLQKGLRTVLGNGPTVVVVWVVWVLAAIPSTWWLADSLHESIGASRVQESLRHRMDLNWLGEYQDGASGAETAFRSVHLGRTALLSNLDAKGVGSLWGQPRSLVAMGVTYALVWILLLGGVLDRWSRGRGRFLAAPFLQSCGRYFVRLLALAGCALPFYLFLHWLGNRLFPWVEGLTRDTTVERTVLLAYASVALVLALATSWVALVFDYAKIVAVLEERANPLDALLRGARFAIQRPLGVAVVYLVPVLVGWALAGLYLFVGPGTAQSTWLGVLLALVAGQVFLFARLGARLWLLASEMEYYRAQRRGG